MFEESPPELERGELDLVDVGSDASVRNGGIEVARTPAADPDGPCQTLVVRTF
jgi:hypothetical protein